MEMRRAPLPSACRYCTVIFVGGPLRACACACDASTTTSLSVSQTRTRSASPPWRVLEVCLECSMTRRIVSFPKHLIYSLPGPGIGWPRVCKFAMAGLDFAFLPSQPDKALSHFLPSRPPLTMSMSMSIHVLSPATINPKRCRICPMLSSRVKAAFFILPEHSRRRIIP